MYTPPHFAQSDGDKIASLIEDNAFGALISVVDGQAAASHIPFLFDREAGRLLGHVAKANPQWQSLASAQDVLVIFQGPHAYVSPTWYHGPGVPTWNYAAAHIHGKARTFDDPAQVQAVVDALAEKYESGNAAPWSGPYNPRMLKSIVGIEIRITDIQAKFKLSQNRPAGDRRSVSAKLRLGGRSEGERLADMMDEI